jgi:hypothetical protein
VKGSPYFHFFSQSLLPIIHSQKWAKCYENCVGSNNLFSLKEMINNFSDRYVQTNINVTHCVCVCVYIYIYVYIHIYTYIYIYVYIYTYICIYMYIYIYHTSHGNPLIFTIILCLPISVKINLISIYVCMCLYRCICTYVFIANVHIPHTYKKARNVWWCTQNLVRV